MQSLHCDNIRKPIWELPIDIELNSEVLHIWRIPVAATNIPHALTTLEQKRADAYTNAEQRQRHITSRNALRTLLSRYTGTPAKDIQITTGPHNKPLLQNNPDLHFNVSHSGSWVFIAIATTPLGIDIEYNDPFFAFTDMLPQYFTPKEISNIEEHWNPRAAFYSFWTRKEAVVKANGTVMDELLHIPVIDGRHIVTEESGIGSWLVRSFELARHTCSFAYGGDIENIMFYETDLILR